MCLTLVLDFSLLDFFVGLSQDTLDASLQNFQQERLSEITDLKDGLVSAQHNQAKAIEERHAALLQSWEKLVAASAVHRQRLLDRQLPLQKVRQKETASIPWPDTAPAF